MKELDFDELDRAVNSLMGSAPKDTAPEAPLEIKSSLPPAGSSESSEASAAEPINVSTAASVIPDATSPMFNTAQPAVIPTPRRSGRFMDMVNTPSNVKPRTSAPNVPSREGLTITPRLDTDTITSTPEATLDQPQTPKTPSSNDMPDPIDVSMMNAQEAEATDEPSIPPTVIGVGESPFLADAKVDKRPLNSGNSLETEVPIEKFDDSLLTTDSVEPNAKVEDEPLETPKVPELDTDLVAIESGESVNDKPVTQAVDSAATAAEVASPAAPLGATSIAQQYTSQPSSGDQSHAAIYDASQYPEPVTHPAKKKSGWLWVLWVLLLLGVGAGGAVLLYTFGIIP